MKKPHHAPGEVAVRVKGKNLTVTPALHDQVVHKMHRLDKYLDRLQEIDVELATESTRDAARHCHVEATTHVAGRTIRVTTVHSEMYAAVDEAVDKLYRQLNRHKERMKSHHAVRLAEMMPGEDSPAGGADEGLSGDSETAEQPAILAEYLDVKPMFEDEAVEEMEASGRQFYVFVNARNEQVHVLYRRDDGHYGLIEPRVR